MFADNLPDNFDDLNSPGCSEVVRLFARWKVLIELKRIQGQHVPLDFVDAVLEPFRLAPPRKLS
jgi:hypothetical protein